MENNSKLVIITGGNRGIGNSVAEKLLESSKFKILITARDEKKLKDAVDSLSEKFPTEKARLLSHQLDVTSRTSIDNFTKWIADRKQKIYILINNAGVSHEFDLKYFQAYFFGTASKEEVDAYWPSKTEIDTSLNTNSYGPINLTEKLLPYLEDNGRILNLSSSAGKLQLQGEKVQKQLEDSSLSNKDNFLKFINSFAELAYKKEHVQNGFAKPIYLISKAFLTAYTRWVLPAQLKKTQTAIAIHPGSVLTGMNPIGTLTLDEGIVSTIAAVNFSEKEALELKGKYINEFGKLDAY